MARTHRLRLPADVCARGAVASKDAEHTIDISPAKSVGYPEDSWVLLGLPSQSVDLGEANPVEGDDPPRHQDLQVLRDCDPVESGEARDV